MNYQDRIFDSIEAQKSSIQHKEKARKEKQQAEVAAQKAVAEAIAQLSIKSVPPAQIQSYLIGILNKQQDGKQLFQKKTGRGSVSL